MDAHVPEGVTPTVAERMAAYYDAAAQDINLLWLRSVEDLLRDSTSRAGAFREQRAAQLAVAMQRRLADIGVNGGKILRGPTEQAIQAAIQRADAEAAEMGMGPIDLTRGVGLSPNPGQPVNLGVTFAGIDADAVRVIAQDTAAREVNATLVTMANQLDQHARRASLVFRSVSDSIITQSNAGVSGEAKVNMAIARGIISGDPVIADRAIRDLFRDPKDPRAESVRKLGNKQITVGNATMSVRQYAATLARTRTREATVAARHDRLLTRNIRLVTITGRQSRYFCTRFIGLVCSLDGAVEAEGTTVVPISSLPSGGPPFHPNCSKGTAAFSFSVSSAGRVARAATALATYQDALAKGTLLEKVG